MGPTVTRLRATRPGWVAVELDGTPWRTLPAEAVLRAGLGPGVLLDRGRAAVLARERRRLAALAAAGNALSRRELTRAEVDARLVRKGVAPRQREAALDAVADAGLQSDRRAATARAAAMAARGWGDTAIHADLDARGVPGDLAREAVDALEPEAERARAHAARHGGGLRAIQALARKGFAEESLEPLLPDLGDTS